MFNADTVFDFLKHIILYNDKFKIYYDNDYEN